MLTLTMTPLALVALLWSLRLLLPVASPLLPQGWAGGVERGGHRGSAGSPYFYYYY